METISAEEFSALYASLETMNTKAIVQSMLSVDGLYQETLKAVLPRLLREMSLLSSLPFPSMVMPPVNLMESAIIPFPAIMYQNRIFQNVKMPSISLSAADAAAQENVALDMSNKINQSSRQESPMRKSDLHLRKSRKNKVPRRLSKQLKDDARKKLHCDWRYNVVGGIGTQDIQGSKIKSQQDEIILTKTESPPPSLKGTANSERSETGAAERYSSWPADEQHYCSSDSGLPDSPRVRPSAPPHSSNATHIPSPGNDTAAFSSQGPKKQMPSAVQHEDVLDSHALSVTPQAAPPKSEITNITCPDCAAVMPLADLHTHLMSGCQTQADDDSLEDKSETAGLSVDGLQTCKVCSESIPQKLLLRHVKQRHTLQRFQSCKSCSMTFSSKAALRRHKAIHSQQVGTYLCPHCPLSFSLLSDLEQHEAVHGESAIRNLWPCSHCGKGFSNKYNLAVHERIHTGELPYSCPYCPERFRVKCSMQNHVKSKHRSSLAVDNSRQSSESRDAAELRTDTKGSSIIEQRILADYRDDFLRAAKRGNSSRLRSIAEILDVKDTRNDFDLRDSMQMRTSMEFMGDIEMRDYDQVY